MMDSLNDRLANAEEDAKDTGYIIGTVVDNVDPLGLGRIKVNVPNLFDHNSGDVPWIGPHKKSPFGIGSGFGTYGSPAIGAQVRIKLQDGDPHYGLAEADEYSLPNANPKFKSPQTWGFKDPSGNELFVNMEAQDWQFTHSSGLTLKYDAQGNLRLHVPKDSTTDIVGVQTETVTGNSVKTVGGSDTQTISSGLTISVTGDTTITSSGTMNLSAGSDMNISAGGSVNISGTSINLN